MSSPQPWPAADPQRRDFQPSYPPMPYPPRMPQLDERPPAPVSRPMLAQEPFYGRPASSVAYVRKAGRAGTGMESVGAGYDSAALREGHREGEFVLALQRFEDSEERIMEALLDLRLACKWWEAEPTGSRQEALTVVREASRVAVTYLVLGEHVVAAAGIGDRDLVRDLANSLAEMRRKLADMLACLEQLECSESRPAES